MYITEFLDLLDAIPSSFWGVVFGASISLGGVVLTNRASDKRLAAQHEEERIQRNKEREHALRKEIYLAAAEAIDAAIGAIGLTSRLEVPQENLMNDYNEKKHAIAKMHVISGDALIESIMNFTSEFGALFLGMIAKRAPLMILKNNISTLDRQISASSNDRDRILKLMEQYNLDGSMDQGRWDTLNRNFDFHQNQVSVDIKEKEKLSEKLISDQIQFAEECLRETLALSELVVPVVIGLRAELEIPFDEEKYKLISEQTRQRALTAIMDLIKQLEAIRGRSTEAE